MFELLDDPPDEDADAELFLFEVLFFDELDFDFKSEEVSVEDAFLLSTVAFLSLSCFELLFFSLSSITLFSLITASAFDD